MRFRGLHFGSCVRWVCAVLGIWGACALAEAPAASGGVHPEAMPPAPPGMAAQKNPAGVEPKGAVPKTPSSTPTVAVPGTSAAVAGHSTPATASASPASPSSSPATVPGEPTSLDRPSPAELKGFSLEGQEAPENEGVGWTLFRTFVVLALVLGLIYLTLNHGLRWLMGIKAPGSPGREPLVKVVERVPLDPKRSLFVVKAAGEYLLVGGGEGPLNLISKLDPAEVSRIEAQRTAPSAPLISPFLQKLLSRKGGSTPPSA